MERSLTGSEPRLHHSLAVGHRAFLNLAVLVSLSVTRDSNIYFPHRVVVRNKWINAHETPRTAPGAQVTLCIVVVVIITMTVHWQQSASQNAQLLSRLTDSITHTLRRTLETIKFKLLSSERTKEGQGMFRDTWEISSRVRTKLQNFWLQTQCLFSQHLLLHRNLFSK